MIWWWFSGVWEHQLQWVQRAGWCAGYSEEGWFFPRLRQRSSPHSISEQRLERCCTPSYYSLYIYIESRSKSAFISVVIHSAIQAHLYMCILLLRAHSHGLTPLYVLNDQHAVNLGCNMCFFFRIYIYKYTPIGAARLALLDERVRGECARSSWSVCLLPNGEPHQTHHHHHHHRPGPAAQHQMAGNVGR